MTKRIAIVGKGTAGVTAAVHFQRFFPEHEIVWYFDSSVPTQSVGEGSTLELPKNLWNGVGFSNTELKNVNGSYKTGVYKVNWGPKGENFYSEFPPPNIGYHFSAVELQSYLLEKLKDRVTVVDQNVDYKKVDADFVFNASGTPKTFENFYKSEYIPLNAAYVVQCPQDRPLFDYTLANARKHGWVFGIPLQNRLSFGYMYNKDISSEEEIREDLQDLIDQYKVKPEGEPNKLTFNNYYRKENFESGGRVAHSGNASFFLEPLEATSIGTMDRIQRMAFDIWSGNKSHQQANEEYLNFLNRTELVIMMHYAAGSAHKSDFWDYAQERGEKKLKEASKDPDFRNMYKLVRQLPSMNLAPVAPNFPEYGPWWAGAFYQNIKGLGLEKTLDKLVRF